ncbi:hypothetical protein LguiA_013725 [Lonicera macranthoides]
MEEEPTKRNFMMDNFTGNESSVTYMYRFGASLEGCDLLAVRTCLEFEPKWLKLEEEIHQKNGSSDGSTATNDTR